VAYTLQLLNVLSAVFKEVKDGELYSRPPNFFVPGDFLPMCADRSPLKPVGGCGGDIDKLRLQRIADQKEKDAWDRRPSFWRPGVLACPVAVLGTNQRIHDVFPRTTKRWICAEAKDIPLEKLRLDDVMANSASQSPEAKAFTKR